MSEGTSVLGCTGTLTLGTRGTEGAGEVLIQSDHGPQTFLAWSEEPLQRGKFVLVVGSRGARTVDVVSWSGSGPTTRVPDSSM